MPAQNQTPITKTINDVLCGRGGLSNNHPGNHVFRRIVNENKEFYQECSKPAHKHFIVISIIKSVRQNGGRFIEQKGGVWKEIPTKKAMTKTSQALREQENPGQQASPVSPLSPGSSAATRNKKRKNPAALSRKVSDGPTAASPVLSSAVPMVAGAVEAPRPATGASDTIPREVSCPTAPQHRGEGHFYGEYLRRQDVYSARVIECEIEKALEDLLGDEEDGNAVARKHPVAPAGKYSRQTAPTTRQGPTAALCSDSEEDDGEDEDGEAYDWRPLEITETLVGSFEYAEMCGVLANALSDC